MTNIKELTGMITADLFRRYLSRYNHKTVGVLGIGASTSSPLALFILWLYQGNEPDSVYVTKNTYIVSFNGKQELLEWRMPGWTRAWVEIENELTGARTGAEVLELLDKVLGGTKI